FSWRVRNSETRGKLITLRNQGIGDPLVRRIYQAPGRVGENLRLLTEIEGRNLVVLLRPVLHEIPSDSKVQRQTGRCPPAVLVKRRRVLMARVVGLRIRLVVESGNSDQEVGDIRTCLGAIESESAVERRIRIDI